MKLIAGVDIGNSTTEVCIATVKDDGSLIFEQSAMSNTTGIKGTIENIHGIVTALNEAMTRLNKRISDLDVIRINEATPVIGDTAMETITETIITDSSMIGHNPSTPSGAGVGKGKIIFAQHLNEALNNQDYIIVFDKTYNYEVIAKLINSTNLKITAVILQADEAVLVQNRINKPIPIIDEVLYIEIIPEGAEAAVEVALSGHTIKMLSNPYGIATLFNFTAEETKSIVPIAKSLIGNRSGVVIKTPSGQIKERIIPAGELYMIGAKENISINVDEGAEKIMEALNQAGNLKDIQAQSNTNAANMLYTMKKNMAELTEDNNIYIKDILAVDTMIPVKVQGALAGETCMEKAVGIAVMVKTQQLPMEKMAVELKKVTGVFTHIAGVEAVMASLGALTTAGVALPVAILDLGGGSTDAALLDKSGTVRTIHLAGAGAMVTMLIQRELGLSDSYTAEQIKKYPVAKVESLFHIHMENGEIKFFDTPLEPKYFGKIVLLDKEKMFIVENIKSIEKIIKIRREAKRKVFAVNAVRALKEIAYDQNIKNIPNVVLVGGSAEDFEIPEILLQELSVYRIVCGRGNIRRTQGARNAVATGLVMSYIG